jgi:hypothetical protein
MGNAATAIRASAAEVQLNLDVARRSATEFQVAAQVLTATTASQTLTDLVVYVAVVEQNLSSSVNAGENKNVLLEHAHTVRQLIGPLPVVTNQISGKAGRATNTGASTSLTLDPLWKPEDLSLVAYVQQRGTLPKLQAVALSLCDAGAVSPAAGVVSTVAPAATSTR